MSLGPDRIQLLKRESAAGGGQASQAKPWGRPINPQQDAVESAGGLVQCPEQAIDETVGWYRHSGEFGFFDQKLSGGVSLSVLLGMPTIIFKPGGADGGITFTSWATIATFITAFGGRCIILIDDSLGAAAASSNVDCKGLTIFAGWKRQSITQPVFTINDGVTLTDPARFLYLTVKAGPTNAATRSIKLTLAQPSLTFEDSAVLELQAAATVAAIHFTVAGAVRFFQNSTLTRVSGSIAIIHVDANLSLIVRKITGPSSTASDLPANAIACAAGTGALTIVTDASMDRVTQTAWVGSGGQTNTRFDRQINIEPSSGTTAARPTDVRPGQMYYDTDTDCPIWWDGSVWAFARAPAAIITGTANVGITATSDTLVTGLTVTPIAGTYEVIAEGGLTAQNSRTLTISLYVAGAQVTATERPLKGDIGSLSGDAIGCFSLNRRVTVNGSQAIEIRGRVSGGATSVMMHRMLSIERVG